MARKNGVFVGSVIGTVNIVNGTFRGKEVNGTFKLIEGFKVGKKSSYVTVEATQELYNILSPSQRKDFITGMKVRINVTENNVHEFITENAVFDNNVVENENKGDYTRLFTIGYDTDEMENTFNFVNSEEFALV